MSVTLVRQVIKMVPTKLMSEKMSSSSLNVEIINKSHLINCSNLDAATIAAKLIKELQVIAVPTDTVYGLACSANSPIAIKKLYDIKRRNVQKPIAICVSNLNQVKLWGQANHIPNRLLKRLLPGPVTLVFEKSSMLNNPNLNPDTTKIGIRIPNYKFIQELSAKAGVPIALTSANLSNDPSSLCVQEFECLYSRLGGIFDGGVLGDGKDYERAGSTVVDLSVIGFYTILREGVAFAKTKKLLEEFGIFENYN